MGKRGGTVHCTEKRDWRGKKPPLVWLPFCICRRRKTGGGRGAAVIESLLILPYIESWVKPAALIFVGKHYIRTDIRGTGKGEQGGLGRAAGAQKDPSQVIDHEGKR